MAALKGSAILAIVCMVLSLFFMSGKVLVGGMGFILWTAMFTFYTVELSKAGGKK